MFKHELGAEAIDIVTKMKGTLVARAEHLFGCNRYLMQGEVGKDNKVPDCWWGDEDELQITGSGITKIVEKQKNKETVLPKKTGGQISKKY